MERALEPIPEELLKAFQDQRPAFVEAYLRAVGIAPHERTARWDHVPDLIKKSLPKQWSFGLCGGFGIGKTFAVSAMVRRIAERATEEHMTRLIEAGNAQPIRRAVEEQGIYLRPWPSWINWPESTAKARAQLFNRYTAGEVETWILDTLLDPGRLLILDDIGAEAVTAQDWVGQLLARVIDERHRHQGATCWTSNLDAKGLVDRYGPRTFSRLQDLAPIVQLTKMPDLRLQNSHRKAS